MIQAFFVNWVSRTTPQKYFNFQLDKQHPHWSHISYQQREYRASSIQRRLSLFLFTFQVVHGVLKNTEVSASQEAGLFCGASAVLFVVAADELRVSI